MPEQIEMRRALHLGPHDTQSNLSAQSIRLRNQLNFRRALTMRCLYFSPRICWPLISGAHLRDFYFARQLARNAQLKLRFSSSP